MLKVACSGPGVSRTRNLSVTSPILYHYTTAPTRWTVAYAAGEMTESGGVMCTDDADETSSAMLAKHAYTVDKLVVYVSNKVGALDADSGGRPAGRPRPAGVCGSTAVLPARDGVRRSQRVHVACRQRRSSRFVYVEATSDRGRQRRPFVQPCRVMVYD